MRSLAAALEARDGYTGEHSDAVHALSVAVASKLGLYPREVAEVEAVALLHDVGKIGIPDQILHKPGPLTADEWVLMREHPVIGERILRPLPGLSDVATAVRHEHERWDGRGYPDGMAGEDIPLASRIVLTCDAYNALVSDRPYRKRLSDATAEAELRRCSGTQFDPRVVDALLECIAEGVDEAPERGAEDLARALADEAGHGGGAAPRARAARADLDRLGRRRRAPARGRRRGRGRGVAGRRRRARRCRSRAGTSTGARCGRS